MNDQAEDQEKVKTLIRTYIEAVRKQLSASWAAWPIELANPELYEVVGALLARQVSLATQLASSPGVWNGHVAPLFLRSMTDTYITLAWILKDPIERARNFVLHGIGQEKLVLEHHKAALREQGKDPDKEEHVQLWEKWLSSQRFPFLTEVNIGSWSGIDTRKMAEDADCLDLYRHAYTPFSSATHSMWNHVSKYNLKVCQNPLHRFHCVPYDPDLDPDFDYVYRAAKYVEKTFGLFSEKTGSKADVPSAFDMLCDELDKLSYDPRPADQEDPPSA